MLFYPMIMLKAAVKYSKAIKIVKMSRDFVGQIEDACYDFYSLIQRLWYTSAIYLYQRVYSFERRCFVTSI